MLNFEYITKQTQLGNFLKDLQRSSILSLDIETTSLDPFTGTLLLLQIKVLDNIYLFDTRKLKPKVLNYIVSLIKESNVTSVGHNIKFDIAYLKAKTGILLEKVYDTMVLEAIITGGNERYASLNKLLQQYLNKKIDKDIRDEFIDFEGELNQQHLIYGAKDVEYLIPILEKQKEIIQEEKMERVMELEMKLVPVVAQMELNGVAFDSESWYQVYLEVLEDAENYELESKKFFWEILKPILPSCRIDEFEERDKEISYNVKVDNLYKLYVLLNIPVNTLRERDAIESISIDNIDFAKEKFYEDFNLNSHKQVKTFLNVIGINTDSTGAKVLTKYKRKHKDISNEHKQVIEYILTGREKWKKESSYGKNFIEAVHPETGRLHGDYLQVGSRTGRFSVSSPALQQVPREEKYRKCFIAPKGKKLITADYSQQELRYVGDVFKEPKIINAYAEEKDVHRLTASLVFDTPYNKVTKDERFIGKTVNFAVMYGTTIYGLADNLGLSLNKAQEILDNFFSKYSILGKSKTLVEEMIWERGYSVTPLGRRRYFDKPDLWKSNSHHDWFKAMVLREGFNHIIQGGSADMLKLAMIKLHYDNPFGEDKLKIIMIIHDEIVIEVDEDIAEEAEEFLIECMDGAANEMMEYIEAKTDSTINDYWSK